MDGDEQLRARGAVVPDATGPGLRVATPLQLDGMAPHQPATTPTLGQHSLPVLRAAGLTEEQIARQVPQGVVTAPDR